MLRWLNKQLIQFLAKESTGYRPPSTSNPELLAKSLRPGDVLLVEGTSRVAKVIKYLSQSTWSHSALYLGEERLKDIAPGHCLIEADVRFGVRTLDLTEYQSMHNRICRPIGLQDDDLDQLAKELKTHLGKSYDMKNITDLARYLLPMPPVPQRWRRRMLQLGSGDPTKVICSSMIAQAFQHIHYPVLPIQKKYFFEKRHYTLFTPADFDQSPFFQIIKPTLEYDFSFKDFEWDMINKQEN